MNELPHIHHHAVPWFASPAMQTTFRVVLFGAAVALFGSIIFDRHGHTCERCGEKWAHLGTFNAGKQSSHACPRCGTVQWWKDHAR